MNTLYYNGVNIKTTLVNGELYIHLKNSLSAIGVGTGVSQIVKGATVGVVSRYKSQWYFNAKSIKDLPTFRLEEHKHFADFILKDDKVITIERAKHSGNEKTTKTSSLVNEVIQLESLGYSREKIVNILAMG